MSILLSLLALLVALAGLFSYQWITFLPGLGIGYLYHIRWVNLMFWFDATLVAVVAYVLNPSGGQAIWLGIVLILGALAGFFRAGRVLIALDRPRHATANDAGLANEALVLGFVLHAPAQEIAKACAACHTDQFEELQTHKHFSKSVFCDTCHGTSEQHRNAVGATPPDKVAAPEAQPGLCGTCHPAQRKPYEGSKHGVLVLAKSKTRAASCGTCHGVHSARNAGGMLRQCERCHAELPAACKKEGGEAGKLVCAGCHEPHGLGRK